MTIDNPSPPCLVLEQTGKWATFFRGCRNTSNMPIVETRTWEDCRRRLEQWPAALVVFELRRQKELEVVKRLVQMREQFPLSAGMVAASRGLEDWELPLREAGAVHVTFSPRNLPPLVAMIRRHLARAPQRELTLREQIWASLPWQRYA